MGTGPGEAAGTQLIPGLRLVAVRTETPSVLVLVLENHDEAPPPSALPGDYSVNGVAPAGVGRFSATRYEDRCVDWKAQRYPQIITHRMYLALARPLEEGQSCAVRFPGGATNLVVESRALLCEAFKVNQVGYGNPAEGRAAFFAPWAGDLSLPAFQPGDVWLCDAASGHDLRQVPIVAAPPDPTVGGPDWQLDLSGVLEPGEYFLRLPGAGRSPPFGVGDEYAHHTFYVHLKGFYHQRCGVALERPSTEWERPACHRELEVTEARPPDFIKERGTRRIVHVGGHHDAGDFDVRWGHTLVAGWLLDAFELQSRRFVDGQLDIPEGTNGIPDLLDEALFSLRAWEGLQEADGGIRAGFEADRHPTYGDVNAATDKLVYRTFARHGHTTLAGAALMAYAARLVQPYDAARARTLLESACKAWGFYDRHRTDPAYLWSPGALLFAGCQLYLATGDEVYHDEFKRQARAFFNLGGPKLVWPAEYNGTYYNLDTVNRGAVFTHYFASYLLSDRWPRDPEIVRAARTALVQKADAVLQQLAPTGFATISTRSWGMSTGVGRYGDFLLHAQALTGEARYQVAARRLADWVMGANPAGRCFTTGLGTRPPTNPTHLDSYRHVQAGEGPVPGLVLYGITEPTGGSPYVRAVTQHLFLSMDKLPAGRRFTDGWSVVEQNEFTVWETMAPNAFLHACLAPETPRRGRSLPWAGLRHPFPIARAESVAAAGH